MEVVITRKGQITIPAEARKALGLKQGDRVSVVVEGDALRVKRELSWVERTRGIFKHDGRPLTPEEENEAFEKGVAQEVADEMRRNA